MCRQHNTQLSVPAAVLLGVTLVAVTTLAIIIVAQAVFPSMRVYEGTTALLASSTALAGTGVIICVVAQRFARRLDEMERRFLARLGAIEGAVSRQQVTYVSVPRPVAQTYSSEVTHGPVGIVRAAGDAPVGLDADTIASARTIARRLMSVGDLPDQDSQQN